MSRRTLTPAATRLWRFVVAEAASQLPVLEVGVDACN
jgi:hypothetical protein